MVYWHVDKKSLCVYSQIKTCASSEVSSMIKGIIYHDTGTEIKNNYVDSHGQSLIAFAFSHILNFRLLPRLKLIGSEKLYKTSNECSYSNINTIITRCIDWEMIKKQYEQNLDSTTLYIFYNELN